MKKRMSGRECQSRQGRAVIANSKVLVPRGGGQGTARPTIVKRLTKTAFFPKLG